MTPEQFAQDYLIHVFYRVTAVVALDGSGSILSARLFDTVWGRDALHAAPGAREIWLLTNHEDGWPELYDADRESIARVRSEAPDAHLRVFVTNEDWGCIPVDPRCWDARR